MPSSKNHNYNDYPYRAPAQSNPYTPEKKQFIMPSIPVFGYVLLAVLSFTAFGFGCQYLTRDLPPNLSNVSSVGFGVGMLTLGVYFLICAVTKASKR